MAVIERGGWFIEMLIYMDLGHFGLELGGCNNEVAALKSDHYTEVALKHMRPALRKGTICRNSSIY